VKQRKRQNSRDRSRLVASEDIVYLSEGEVSRRYESLVRLIEGRGFSRNKRVQLETEACYLWRELETRRARKIAHQEYLKKFNNHRRGGRRG